MKILFILRAMANVAGTERVMSDKINWLADHGHNVFLVTYEQGAHVLSFPLHPNVKTVDLDVRFFQMSSTPLYRRLWTYRKMKAEFLKLLQKVTDDVRPDVIVATTYSMIVIKEIIKVRTNARKIIESHVARFSVGKEFNCRSKSIFRVIAHLYDNYTYKKVNDFDLLLVLTEGDKNDWSQYVDNVKAIPNPLTYYPLQMPSRYSSHRILCVGRLDEQKGFDLMIDAFSKIASKCPEWHVDIYGHGEDEAILRNQIQNKGLENRIFIHNPTVNIYEEYSKSELYVLSSRYEGFGLVLVEAMSCGTPCVAFKCKYGPDEIIEDGVTGLLASEANIDDLAEKMLWMISHDRERLEMGIKAYKAAARYCKEHIMQEWEEAYLSVC